jgi:predicted nucleic acid-binding protein
VIRRPRFNRTGSEIAAALHTIREHGFWVKPTGKVRACSDPDDDIFLECSEAAAAHFLVTGNPKDFPTGWGGTKIVTAREFLATFDNDQGLRIRLPYP